MPKSPSDMEDIKRKVSTHEEFFPLARKCTSTADVLVLMVCTFSAAKRDGINLHHQRCWDFKISLQSLWCACLPMVNRCIKKKIPRILIQIRFWWYSSACSNEWCVNLCGRGHVNLSFAHVHILICKLEWDDSRLYICSDLVQSVMAHLLLVLCLDITQIHTRTGFS